MCFASAKIQAASLKASWAAFFIQACLALSYSSRWAINRKLACTPHWLQRTPI